MNKDITEFKEYYATFMRIKAAKETLEYVVLPIMGKDKQNGENTAR